MLMGTAYDLAAISIHAPREGSDGLQMMVIEAKTIFQSTLPVRGATRSYSPYSSMAVVFQSTLPVRGATPVMVTASPTRKGFQSTLPVRGATSGYSVNRLFL